jgi:hypothetical protein
MGMLACRAVAPPLTPVKIIFAVYFLSIVMHAKPPICMFRYHFITTDQKIQDLYQIFAN